MTRCGLAEAGGGGGGYCDKMWPSGGWWGGGGGNCDKMWPSGGWWGGGGGTVTRCGLAEAGGGGGGTVTRCGLAEAGGGGGGGGEKCDKMWPSGGWYADGVSSTPRLGSPCSFTLQKLRRFMTPSGHFAFGCGGVVSSQTNTGNAGHHNTATKSR